MPKFTIAASNGSGKIEIETGNKLTEDLRMDRFTASISVMDMQGDEDDEFLVAFIGIDDIDHLVEALIQARKDLVKAGAK